MKAKINTQKSVHSTSKATSKAASVSPPQWSRSDLREFLNKKRTQEPTFPEVSMHGVLVSEEVQRLQLEVERQQKLQKLMDDWYWLQQEVISIGETLLPMSFQVVPLLMSMHARRWPRVRRKIYTCSLMDSWWMLEIWWMSTQHYIEWEEKLHVHHKRVKFENHINVLTVKETTCKGVSELLPTAENQINIRVSDVNSQVHG